MAAHLPVCMSILHWIGVVFKIHFDCMYSNNKQIFTYIWIGVSMLLKMSNLEKKKKKKLQLKKNKFDIQFYKDILRVKLFLRVRTIVICKKQAAVCNH